MKEKRSFTYILWIVFLVLVLACGAALLISGALWNVTTKNALEAGETACLRLPFA